MRRSRYSSLSDTYLSPSPSRNRRGQESRAIQFDWQTHELQRGSHDAASNKEERVKIPEAEKDSLRRENELLRNQLNDANVMLRKLTYREDQTSKSGSSSVSSGSSRSSKMRCSVLGRKKNKRTEKEFQTFSTSFRDTSGRISPSEASTVVMGSKSKSRSKSKPESSSKSKSTTMNDEAIKKYSSKSCLKKSFGRSIWSRYLGETPRRNLSPRRSCPQTPERTPPCTPERTPAQDTGLSNLNSPPRMNTLGQNPQMMVDVFQSQLLGIEACLPTSQNGTTIERKDMFISFRTAVLSEILTVEDSSLPITSERPSITQPRFRRKPTNLMEI